MRSVSVISVKKMVRDGWAFHKRTFHSDPAGVLLRPRLWEAAYVPPQGATLWRVIRVSPAADRLLQELAVDGEV